ncbi:MAG: HTH domain-containing protein [Candidatus Pacearchaeota archaeon]|nr:HTH domain-containing protein [Candidatus Pacearchaeota archaeon]
MGGENTENKILKILLKQFSLNWTITSLADEIKMSRVGIWKVLKKLENGKLIILTQIGKGRTSASIIKLNWENLVLEKKLSLILTEEALNHRRWLGNFEELRGNSEFVLLYGSILTSPKEANDIDILEVVSSKKNFLEIEKIIQKSKKSQIKEIHSESFTKAELKAELKKPNKIFIDAVKKGIVLFGQENFIKFVKYVEE